MKTLLLYVALLIPVLAPDSSERLPALSSMDLGLPSNDSVYDGLMGFIDLPKINPRGLWIGVEDQSKHVEWRVHIEYGACRNVSTIEWIDELSGEHRLESREYDNHGRVVSVILTNLFNNVEIRRTTYSYLGNSEVPTRTNTFVNHVLTLERLCTAQAGGWEVRAIEVHQGYIKSISTVRYSVDAMGAVQSASRIDCDGSAHCIEHVERSRYRDSRYRYDYDNHANWTKRQELPGSRSLGEGPSMVVVRKFQYCE
jgi:hypothetical protein